MTTCEPVPAATGVVIRPRAVNLGAKPPGFDAAMRHALAHAQEQSMVIEMLLDKVADLHAQLVVARKVARMPRPPRAEHPGRYEERIVRQACEMLRVSYDAITERGPAGNLRRCPDLIAARDRVIMHLLSPQATPTGPMSFIGIARGLRCNDAHATIIGAERRVMKALGVERPNRRPKRLQEAA